MIDVNQLRRGVTFTHDGNLFKVTEYQHNKPGRGKATIRVNVRNLPSGANLQLTFSSGDRVEDVRLDKRVVQYLYDDGSFYVFMDTETYDQTQVGHHVLEDDVKFLKENMEVHIMTFQAETLGVELPNTVELEVAETEPGIKGDTSSGGTKSAVLETGLSVQVPFFINQGDKLLINTNEGSYVSRA